jgi:hypothetical protein
MVEMLVHMPEVSFWTGGGVPKVMDRGVIINKVYMEGMRMQG